MAREGTAGLLEISHASFFDEFSTWSTISEGYGLWSSNILFWTKYIFIMGVSIIFRGSACPFYKDNICCKRAKRLSYIKYLLVVTIVVTTGRIQIFGTLEKLF
jgi:hypothetical protein